MNGSIHFQKKKKISIKEFECSCGSNYPSQAEQKDDRVIGKYGVIWTKDVR
jgi:hypothetical protein